MRSRGILTQFVYVTFLVLLSLAPLRAQIAAGVVPDRLTVPIDENNRVTLSGTVHPLAQPSTDRALAPVYLEPERMHLVLKRTTSQEAALRELIAEESTPGSPNYHQWLTPDQFGA